jgi:hypothetical protein
MPSTSAYGVWLVAPWLSTSTRPSRPTGRILVGLVA